jgi:hypothetical protein
MTLLQAHAESFLKENAFFENLIEAYNRKDSMQMMIQSISKNSVQYQFRPCGYVFVLSQNILTIK